MLYNNPHDSGVNSEREDMKYRHPRHVPHMTQLSSKPKLKMKKKTGQDRKASKSFRKKLEEEPFQPPPKNIKYRRKEIFC